MYSTICDKHMANSPALILLDGALADIKMVVQICSDVKRCNTNHHQKELNFNLLQDNRQRPAWNRKKRENSKGGAHPRRTLGTRCGGLGSPSNRENAESVHKESVVLSAHRNEAVSAKRRVHLSRSMVTNSARSRCWYFSAKKASALSCFAGESRLPATRTEMNMYRVCSRR